MIKAIDQVELFLCVNLSDSILSDSKTYYDLYYSIIKTPSNELE